MTIVVGVDGSAAAEQALRWAIGEAHVRKTGVRAVYAWDVPAGIATAKPRFGGARFGAPEVGLEKLHRSAALRVSEVVDRALDSSAVERVAVRGRTADVLVGQAQGADLLVVGSESGPSGGLVGVVSQSCVEHAPCPVVIVREQERETSGEHDAAGASSKMSRERVQNRQTWAMLERLGVAEGTRLRLDFLYESGGPEADETLARHLRAKGYSVEVEDDGVTGSTRPMPVGPTLLDGWVAEMIASGEDHGGCRFDGWTATIAAGRSHRLLEARRVKTAA